ncbi:MAG: site-specific DNA-methyltransferase [Methanobrevibacter sp.]|jgi:adenine-specific DNA-methyltransferase|nr:site-specific DNA-methyltransferase [Candidatus Methanoflexus mossambicus]
MYLNYSKKKSDFEILNEESKSFSSIYNGINTDLDNILIHGENFEVLKSLINDVNLKQKVNLIYIDPPFSTNNIFKISSQRANSISSSNNDEIAYKDTLKGSEFIEFLRERLILLNEILADTGSIYLHIDYKIGHYVKVMMDEIFGIENFRGDIARVKCNPKNFKRKSYGNMKDLILFYTKTDNYVWNEPRVPLSEDEVKKLCGKVDGNGQRYTTVPLHAPGETKNGATGEKWKGMYPPKGRHWRSSPEELDKLEENGLIEWSKNGVPRKKIYAEEKIRKGKLLQDIWTFKDPQKPLYPTEKNNELLEQIIKTSSNPNDLVLDCFCGSGTTLISAQKLNRRWIGIDESEKAIEVTKSRFSNIQTTLFNDKVDYKFYDLKSIT